MDDPHKAILKAKSSLYGKQQLFARAIRMDNETYRAAEASICFTRSKRTQLVEAIQGLKIIVDNTISGFTLEDFYDPMEESDDATLD